MMTPIPLQTERRMRWEMFALSFTALCFLPNWLLWRKKIFLKV